MRVLKFCMAVGLILAVSGTAGAIDVPTPGIGLVNIQAHSGFAEIFLEVGDTGSNVLGLGAGLYNDVAIGFSSDVDGAGSPGYVLYTGANSTTGAAATGPTTILAIDTTGDLIEAIFEGGTIPGVGEQNTRGRLYVGGIIDTITNLDTNDQVNYPVGVGEVEDTPIQLTYSLYNAYVSSIALFPADSDGTIKTEFVLSDAAGEEIHFDIWADSTADVGNPGTGLQRYLSAATTGVGAVSPELPLRDDDAAGNAGTLLVDIDTGQYYDMAAGGWGDLDFAGNPADGDEVWLSFIGNPDSTFQLKETFNASSFDTFTISYDPDGPGGVDPYDITFQGAGPSDLQTSLLLEGQLIPGMSLAPAAKTDGGYGTGQGKLLHPSDPDADWVVSANFNFGSIPTGTYDSDPRTFTFQNEPGSVSDLNMKGYFIPEPLTMLGVLVGVGSISSYIRKRRLA